jgi:hypothetical protein
MFMAPYMTNVAGPETSTVSAKNPQQDSVARLIANPKDEAYDEPPDEGDDEGGDRLGERDRDTGSACLAGLPAMFARQR